jgi:hypothetical protein
MTPPTLNENDRSPAWSASSGGTNTPAAGEGENNNEGHGNPNFFPIESDPTRVDHVGGGNLYRQDRDILEEDDDGDDEADGMSAFIAVGDLEPDAAVESNIEGLKVETVYGDEEDEEEEEAGGERHQVDDRTCLIPMTGGRLCGKKNCKSRIHEAKTKAGKRGANGWYCTAVTSPTQAAAGNFHVLANTFQSDAEHEAIRKATRLEVERVADSLNKMGLDSGPTQRKSGYGLSSLKKGAALMEETTEPKEEPVYDHMLDEPEDDDIRDMTPGLVVAEAKTKGKSKADSKAQVKDWLDQEALRGNGSGGGKGAVKMEDKKIPPSEHRDVNHLSTAAFMELLAEEKQAREVAEQRMDKMWKETQQFMATSARTETTKNPEVKEPGATESTPTGRKKGKSGNRNHYNSDSESSVEEPGPKNLTRCHSKVSGYGHRNPSRATWKATPTWYVVLVGKQVGIYRSWERARSYVDGFSNSYSRKFKCFSEAKAFFRANRGELDSGCEYDSDSESSVSNAGRAAVVTPIAKSAKKPTSTKKVTIADPDSEYDTACESPKTPESHQGKGKQGNINPSINISHPIMAGYGLEDVVLPLHAGADKSTKTNEVHEINMANEAAAYRLLAPPGAGSEVEKSLVNAALDVASLPGKNIYDYSAETALQEISTTLSESLRGEEFQARGRIGEDHRWKNATKDHLRTIKSLDDLRSSQELLHEIEEEAVANMENGWRAVLYEHMGWDEDTINLWLRVGVLPNIIRHSLQNYKALLSEVEYMSSGNVMSRQAEIFLAHHASKLGMIRTHRARTRLQLVWMTYTYLRDARQNRFASQGLLSKQTDALREEMDSLRQVQIPRNNRNNRNNPVGGAAGNNNPGGGGGGQRGQQQDSNQPEGEGLLCSGCKSRSIHPGIGKRGCPFKEFPDVAARKMAKTAEELMTGGKARSQALNEAIQKHRDGG